MGGGAFAFAVLAEDAAVPGDVVWAIVSLVKLWSSTAPSSPLGAISGRCPPPRVGARQSATTCDNVRRSAAQRDEARRSADDCRTRFKIAFFYALDVADERRSEIAFFRGPSERRPLIAL